MKLFNRKTIVLPFVLACLMACQDREVLTVYTALEDDQVQAYLADFHKKHPEIQVQTVRNSSGIIAARLMAEKASPQADLVWGLAATAQIELQEAGLLEPFAPTNLNAIDPKFRDQQAIPHWVGIDAWMSAWTVNTVELKKRNLRIPQSYEDLIKPEYKGLITMPHPASSGTGYFFVSALLQLKGDSAGWAYLDSLDRNIAQYVHSGSKPAKLAAAGEYPIGISLEYRGLVLKRKGAPVEVIWPQEGSGWEVEANSLIRKDSIKPAARVFLEWAASRAAMELYAQNFGMVADTGVNVPRPEGYPKDPESLLMADYSFMQAAKQRSQILKNWEARFASKVEKP